MNKGEEGCPGLTRGYLDKEMNNLIYRTIVPSHQYTVLLAPKLGETTRTTSCTPAFKKKLFCYLNLTTL